MKKNSLLLLFLASLMFSLVFTSDVFAVDPYGWLDAADCTSFRGWACDPDSFSTSIDVHFYEEPAQASTFLGATTASGNRSDLAGSCGGTINHAFSFPTPDKLRDGKDHQIDAFAINTPAGGNNPPLLGVPKKINCPPPPPICTGAYPSVNATVANSGTLRVYASGVQNATSVKFPTWSELGGQDDIIWYDGVNDGGGTWHADVDLSKHPGVSIINVHIYMYNSAYTNQWCGTANFKRIGGNHDGADCSATWGWTCDPSDFTTPTTVYVYRDGPAGAGGVRLGATTANQSGEAAIGSICGNQPTNPLNTNHRFSFPISYAQYPQLYDGATHSLYTYAINLNGGTNPPLFPSTPKTFGPCTASPTPTPTPTPTPAPASAPCPTQSTNPRVKSGLISTPDISVNFGNPEGRCVVDPKAAFASYKIDPYEDLKSKYYTQAKDSATVNKVEPPFNPPFSLGDFNSNMQSAGNSNKDALFLVQGDMTIKGYAGFPSPGSNKSAVIFVDGKLNIEQNIDFGGNSSGLVLVVKGDVIIDPSVTNINAVIISSGTIYTAGANCTTSSVTANPLVVNGSLVSIDGTKNIEFCRSLADNSCSGCSAEKINQQPKYLIIMRNLYSDNPPKWSEIP